MLTLTASDADFMLAVNPERRGQRALIVALGASLLLHALAIALLPGLRLSPPVQPVTLTVELQEPPPVPEVSPRPEEVPTPVAAAKRPAPPKPVPSPAPPQLIERIEPQPSREPETFTAPPPPVHPEVKPAPIVEPMPVPRTEPHAEVSLQTVPPIAPPPAVVKSQPAEPDPALLQSYGQLRRMEGILRRWSFEGEILLPDDEPAQHRVAVRCGFANAAEFMRALKETRAALRAVYARHFHRE